MALKNVKVIEDERTTQTRAQAAIESYNTRSDEQDNGGLTSIRKARRLDVDAVLARSIPSLTDTKA